jgi:dephospho-CoA kinase
MMEFPMDKRLKEKMDLMINRSTGKKHMDNLIVIDGDEGIGKSTLSVYLANYYASKTGRPFSVDNIFFDIHKLIKFAQTTEDQIIIWDEAALGGLSTEHAKQHQVNLTKLLMTARKKRHFWIFNIPKFFKLNEYILVDRAIALIHVYARREIHAGRFCYYKKKAKERLFYDRIRTRQRNYYKYMSFWGTFPNCLTKIIDETEYDRKKDEAIASIGNEVKKNPWERKLLRIIEFMLDTGRTHKEIGELTGIPRRTVTDYANRAAIQAPAPFWAAGGRRV